MSILRKPYEISLWADVWNGEKFVEAKQFVFGSDTMEYQGRAIEPKLVRKTNGEVSLSFKMCYQFIDTVTGEKVDNPFIAEIVNESKVKLKYNNEWFDLLVKNISKDSSGKSCTYQLTSQYVQELSKNGFDLTLDTQLMNNMGTVDELGRRVLENTDWGVQSEKVVQTQDETLVMLTVNSQIKAYKINDSNLTENGATIATSTTTIPKGAKIYAFYSSCSGDKPYYFQFIYKNTSGFSEPYRGLFSTYSDRIISDLGCQYVIDQREWQEDGDFVIPTDFIIDAGRENDAGIGNSSALSVLYRGRRYVYNQVTEYHTGLDMYLQKYKSNTDGKLYYKYTKTNFVTPNLIENIVTNTDFKQASGWNGVKFNDANPSTSVKLVAATTTVKRNYHSSVWDIYTELGHSGSWSVSGLKKGEYCYIPDCTVSDEDEKSIYPIFEVLADSPTSGGTQLVSLGRVYGPKPPTTFEINFSSSEHQSIIEPIYAKKNTVDFTSSTAAMLDGKSPIGDSGYKPYLSCGKLFNFVRANGKTALGRVIRNTGPKDKKSSFAGLTEGEKYRFDLSFYIIKHETEPATRLTAPYTIYTSVNKTNVKFKIAQHNFDAKNLGYSVNSLTNKDINDKILFNVSTNANKGSSNAFSCSVELEALRGLTEEELKDANYQMFLEFPDVPQDSATSDNKGKTVKYYVWIEKIEFYKMIPKKSGGYYTPDDPIDSDNMEYNTEEKYFLIEDNQNKPLKDLSFAPANMTFTPVFTSDGAKKSSINVKESNYFNAIQQLAETFNSWAALEINHDEDGNLINFKDSDGTDLGYSKRIYFKNYIGQENFAGFKYGINERHIKRTLDSAQIVSKLIVKMNSNQYGPSGFCSISRASVNPQKDNVLYDFGYYANQGLLDADSLQTDLYIMSAEDKVLLKNGLSKTVKIPKSRLSTYLRSSSGYYSKLSMLNKALEDLTSDQQENRMPLNQEIADYNTYKTLYDSATEGLIEAQNNFYAITGYAYTQIPEDQVESVYENTTLKGYLETISSLSSEQSTAEKKYKAATNNKKKYEEALEVLQIKYDNALLLKNELYRLFYNKYSRFIQEGTWIDESYYDDNLYYNDATSVLYNSSMPKVSYDISVISLAGIPGYELFGFKIGDQTFVEDTDFFGYDREGLPYREKITITETTEDLDDPSKNSIKVQNYENQFQDLFQKITATVQSVQYTEGSYKKAEALANADIAHKVKFLSGAISDADTVLKNNGAQDWTLDESGLTLASRSTGSKLRAVGGAILLGEVGDDGKDKWVTGLTANGISANLITAGSINTGTIQIMNGEEPTFRWDSHGITAYDFDNTSSDTVLSAMDKTKGVRFDRFGLYGYSGIDGEKWKPKSISGKNDGVPCIDDKSTFSLTWEGLKVKNQNGTTLKIGDGSKTNSNDNNILRVFKGTTDKFVITEDGSIKMNGNISIAGNITWDIQNKPNITFDKNEALILTTTGTNSHTSARTRKWADLALYEQPGYTNLDGWSVTSAGYSAIENKGGGNMEGVIIGVPVTITDRNNMIVTIYLMVTGKGTGYTSSGPKVAVRGVQYIDYGENETKNNLLAALDGTEGIYNLNGKIAINASMIQTGFIKLKNGTTETDYFIDPFNSQGKGVYMKIPGLEVKTGGVTVEGTIIAEKGNIGDFQIVDKALKSPYLQLGGEQTEGNIKTILTSSAPEEDQKLLYTDLLVDDYSMKIQQISYSTSNSKVILTIHIESPSGNYLCHSTGEIITASKFVYNDFITTPEQVTYYYEDQDGAAIELLYNPTPINFRIVMAESSSTLLVFRVQFELESKKSNVDENRLKEIVENTTLGRWDIDYGVYTTKSTFRQYVNLDKGLIVGADNGIYLQYCKGYTRVTDCLQNILSEIDRRVNLLEYKIGRL